MCVGGRRGRKHETSGNAYETNLTQHFRNITLPPPQKDIFGSFTRNMALLTHTHKDQAGGHNANRNLCLMNLLVELWTSYKCLDHDCIMSATKVILQIYILIENLNLPMSIIH